MWFGLIGRCILPLEWSHGSGVVRLRAKEIRLLVVVRIDHPAQLVDVGRGVALELRVLGVRGRSAIAFFIFSMTLGASGHFAASLELAAASAACRWHRIQSSTESMVCFAVYCAQKASIFFVFSGLSTDGAPLP